MSVQDENDSQFRCMICNFTATSKAEIGTHFLTDHMEAYVSPVKDERPEAEKETTDEEKGQETKPEAAVVHQPKPRGRPRKQVSKVSKSAPAHDEAVEAEEEEEAEKEEQETQQFGRGMRRRKKATPRHILRYEMVDEEYMDDDEYSIDHQKEKRKVIPKKKIPAIMPLTMKEKAKRKTRKSDRSRGSREQEEEQEDENDANPQKYEKKPRRSSIPKLPLSVKVIDKIIEDRVTQWYLQFTEKFMLPLPCPFERCTEVVTQAEMEVHIQCHAANLEGFRCPVAECEFLCPHWANMRVHYRKAHEPSFCRLLCGVDECSMFFPRIDQKVIKVHVTRKHLRPQLYKELLGADFSAEKYDNYITAVKTEDEQSAEREGIELDVSNTENDADVNEKVIESALCDKEEPAQTGVEVKKPKKRGRPRGSTKAAKLAMGEPLGKKDKKEQKKTRRRSQKALNHVAFFCDICGAKYKSEELVNQHRSMHYREDDSPMIHCTECNDFNSDEPSDLRDHVAASHKRLLQLHRCDACNFATHRYHDLKKHLMVHSGSKDYMCDKCGTCTTTAYNLRVHWRRYHAPEEDKKISCFACPYKCADNGILKEHIRSKHGLMVYGKDYDNARPMPTFACPQCDYIGRKKSSLSYHMRIHTENRQFKCHICPYASKTKNNLLLHIRTHEGMQPLKCPECDFKGATNKIISEHVMCKHARVRPYTCKVCGWTSSYHGNMWKHVETHRKELGDKMPEEPVTVVSIEGHRIAAPLKGPTLKKRGGGSSSAAGGSAKKTKGKRNHSRYETMPTTIEVTVEPQEVAQNIKEGEEVVNVIQVPVSSMLNQEETITLTEGISEEAAIGASALSRLAQGTEITVREVHFLQSGDNQDQHHEMVTYNVPPVAVTQQIIAGGDMGQVIAEHHYPPPQQQQPQHQQQHQQQVGPEQDGDRYQEISAQVVTTQENVVPNAVTEQIVHAMAPGHRQEQTVVHHLIPMTLSHEAELVMSMMHAHHANVSQQ